MRGPKDGRRPDADIVRSLEVDARLRQARSLREAGRIAEAAQLCHRILMSDPRRAAALQLMGSIALQTGDLEIAIGSLQRALLLEPRSAATLVELGEALHAAGRHAEAVSAFRKAIALSPRSARAFAGLADAQLDSGARKEAERSYRRAHAIDPTHARAAHMAAALSGEDPAGATAAYARALFDSYAGIFETHLATTLGYDVPVRLRDALAPHAPAGGAFASALDLGCGTGLVAAALGSLAPVIDGIDISPRMVAAAAAKERYRSLRAGGLVEVMAGDQALSGPYDLVTAADVFIYVGALDAVFAAVRRVMAPQGLLAFSVEEAGAEGVALRSSGRFAHGRDYVLGLAAAHRFSLLAEEELPIRKERDTLIPGRLFVFRAASG